MQRQGINQTLMQRQGVNSQTLMQRQGGNSQSHMRRPPGHLKLQEGSAS